MRRVRPAGAALVLATAMAAVILAGLPPEGAENDVIETLLQARFR